MKLFLVQQQIGSVILYQLLRLYGLYMFTYVYIQLNPLRAMNNLDKRPKQSEQLIVAGPNFAKYYKVLQLLFSAVMYLNKDLSVYKKKYIIFLLVHIHHYH